jgi:hypothetical protein
LQDERARNQIVSIARELVLSEHTYDLRVEKLLTRIREAGNRRLAPARSWRARLMALDFYAAHGLADCAAAQFRHVAGHGFRETMEGASLLTRAWRKSLRARWS